MMDTSLFDLIPIFISAFVAVVILTIGVTLIVVIGKTKQAQSVDIKSFEKLAHELKVDHEELKSELVIIKETLNSINKMMKEID